MIHLTSCCSKVPYQVRIGTVQQRCGSFGRAFSLKIPNGIFNGKYFICVTGSSNGIQFETLRRLLKMKATKAKNAYMKKKDPLFVRESLLNAAFELAATKGMADVTVNKVSELADVTKGAFFHHFDSKETLVTELMQMLLARLDKQFDRLMAEEENSDGCFTRAYIRAAFSEGADERKVWGALLSLMASRDEVGRVWDNWLSERLKRHSKTDSRIELRVIRLAADGVWLERIVNEKSKNLKGVEEYLTKMTRR
jgi:AcrR family transcriptional regulator